MSRNETLPTSPLPWGPRPKETAPAPRRRLLRPALLCGTVCAAVGLAAWLLIPVEKPTPAPVKAPPPPKAAPKAPPAQKPAVQAPATNSAPAEAPRPVDPDARPTKVGEVVNGYVMLPSGRIHKPTGAVTNDVARYARSRYSIFAHRSENEIASVLMQKPGDTLVGTRRYTGWFKDQFLKSLENPIITYDDDEPWKADLKKAVIQAKMDLKEALDRGEDIEKIMSDTRQQLQDLARYKQQLKQTYFQEKGKCESEADVENLQKALNKMLEDKGCAPMDFTPLTKRNLMKDKEK